MPVVGKAHFSHAADADYSGRCDLTRPCKTCCEREHPELCAYNPPPNKRLNVGPGPNDNKSDEAVMGGPGFVTIGRSELDKLFNKLNGLEESIAEMREEMSFRRGDHHERHELDNNGGAGPAEHFVDGRVRRPTHTDVHGVHMKNDAVSCKLIVTIPRMC